MKLDGQSCSTKIQGKMNTLLRISNIWVAGYLAKWDWTNIEDAAYLLACDKKDRQMGSENKPQRNS
jgi:hypothetical protein